jgi:hypothetical protein
MLGGVGAAAISACCVPSDDAHTPPLLHVMASEHSVSPDAQAGLTVSVRLTLAATPPELTTVNVSA